MSKRNALDQPKPPAVGIVDPDYVHLAIKVGQLEEVPAEQLSGWGWCVTHKTLGAASTSACVIKPVYYRTVADA